MPNSPFNADCFNKALQKVKKGKSSPDGVTAEMLQALPPAPRAALASDIERRCAYLDFPAEWMESTAAMAPKVVGAIDLSKFRPIACLVTMRKI